MHCKRCLVVSLRSGLITSLRVSVCSFSSSTIFVHLARSRTHCQSKFVTRVKSTPVEVGSDDIEDIKVGKFMYFMGDSGVERNCLGEVLEMDGASRQVKFGEVTLTVPASDLDVCNLQKGAYVVPSDDVVNPDQGA